MSKNEVIEEEAQKVSAINPGDNLVVIKDLSAMVKLAKFEEVKSRYGVRHPYYVTLFNNVKIEFVDADGFYDLLLSYSALGDKDYVVSKKLLEEAKITEDNSQGKSFISIKYELKDGTVYRLFPKNFNSKQVFLNYFTLYEKTQNQSK